jgi:hypothetical protein
MKDYRPDNWVVVKMTQRQSHGVEDTIMYKVLAGWDGGYLNVDRWRMNSGINLILNRKDEVHFYGHSGSNYICEKGHYGLRSEMRKIFENLEHFASTRDVEVELLDEDTDWSSLKCLLKPLTLNGVTVRQRQQIGEVGREDELSS